MFNVLNFNFVLIKSDFDATAIVQQVNDVSRITNECLSTNTYGKDVEHFVVGVVIMKVKPGFEKFSEIRKPRYIVEKTMKHPVHGNSFTIKKANWIWIQDRR